MFIILGLEEPFGDVESDHFNYIMLKYFIFFFGDISDLEFISFPDT